MEIRRVSINLLNPSTYNPRKDLKPSDPEYHKLSRSMEQYGYIEPIVWNERTGNIVGGHQRFKILLESGVQEIDVSVVNLSPTDEKALNIALNKISGDWDYECLNAILQDLSQEFDATLTGFDSAEIDHLLSSFAAERQQYDLPGMETHVNTFFEEGVQSKPAKASSPVATTPMASTKSNPEWNIIVLNLSREDTETFVEYLEKMRYDYRIEGAT